MNLLRKAITVELVFSSPSPRKCLRISQPIATLQQSSLYSTSSISSTSHSRLKNQQEQSYNPPNPKPWGQESSQFDPASSNCISTAPRREEEREIGISRREKGWPWPRPTEIPWQAKVANSVNLIGRVQIPVQFKAGPDGKFWAGTIISQRDDSSVTSSSVSPSFWIPVIFEGDLAHVAACHLKENDCVYITGQLIADPPLLITSHVQENVQDLQVMVHGLNFVQGSSQLKKSTAPFKKVERTTDHSGSLKGDIFVNQLWKDLIAKPHEWWDIRLKKDNFMAAAFEHKDNGQLLWINESTPEWIQKKLECLTFDCKIVQKNLNTASCPIDEAPAVKSWRDLLKNPKQWWDHRQNKLNGLVKQKYPDFKHKDSGLALWLDSAPKWVLLELERLEFDVQLRNVKQTKEGKEEDSWRNLVENPDKWWDNRSNKVNEKSPDFKHKDTGKGLWLSDSPAWVPSRLPPLRAKQNVAIDKRNTLLC